MSFFILCGPLCAKSITLEILPRKFEFNYFAVSSSPTHFFLKCSSPSHFFLKSSSPSHFFLKSSSPQCSQNGRFAGIWAGAAKRLPGPFSPFSECSLGNLRAAKRLRGHFGWGPGPFSILPAPFLNRAD